MSLRFHRMPFDPTDDDPPLFSIPASGTVPLWGTNPLGRDPAPPSAHYGTFVTGNAYGWGAQTVPPGPGAPIVHNDRTPKVWPDVQCEPVLMPHTIVYHGERASGRSTALQMLWRDACAETPVKDNERRWREAYPDRAHLRTLLLVPTPRELADLRVALCGPFGPWAPSHDSDIRLYTMTVARYLQVHGCSDASVRNVLIDGWLRLDAQERDAILAAYLEYEGASIRAITL